LDGDLDERGGVRDRGFFGFFKLGSAVAVPEEKLQRKVEVTGFLGLLGLILGLLIGASEWRF
jgi:hypothetical protein